MFFYISAFTLLSCIVLGGGTKGGHLSDAVLELLSIPLLIAALWRILERPKHPELRLALAFCVAVLSVPLIQLVPLPPGLWRHLPGRDSIVAAYELLGRPLSWAPMSMTAQRSFLSLLALLPSLAAFLSLLTLDWPERRGLSLVVIIAAVAGAFLGLAQLAQGDDSPLRFYEITNRSDAVGFFANRNHFAASLYSSIPLISVWLAKEFATVRRRDPRADRQVDAGAFLRLFFMSAALLALVAAEAMARSRAGVMLTMLALFGSFAIARSSPRKLGNFTHIRTTIGAVAFIMLFIGGSALQRLLDRFDVDPLDDSRVAFARNTASAAWSLTPIGAGVGSFVPVYAMFEKPKDLLQDTYANHAHNDLLELWLETGVIGPLLLGAFAFWLYRKAASTWRPSNADVADFDRSLVRAGILMIALLFAHSLVDYPLRTTALMATMAFACGLLIEPARPISAAEDLDAPRRNRSPRGRSVGNRSRAISPNVTLSSH